MSVSTNSVIHYTSKQSTLRNILTDREFNPSCCIEEIEIDSKSSRIAVPMVSFCDIPFSQASTHVKSYGSYAIGLSKKWADQKKLNPVLYIGKDTPVNSALSQILEIIKEQAPLVENPDTGEFSMEKMASLMPLLNSLTIFYALLNITLMTFIGMVKY